MLANPVYLRHRPEMFSDPLSEALDLVNARCAMSGSLLAGGRWAVQFPAPGRIKFNAVVKGECFLALDGLESPIRLEAGDAVLLNGRHSFVLASDLSADRLQAIDLFANAPDMVARIGSCQEFHAVGGHVSFDATGIDLLFDVLPPVVHVKSTAPEAAAIGWLLSQLVGEMAASRPGTVTATSQLAQLVFLQVLRAHIAASEPLPAGWLRAIGDEKIAPAIRLMHAEPARSWQLGELAKAVGMSRTTFAERFKTVSGMAPLAYLADWRMRLARRALQDGATPVSALAASLGYSSESAFSNAFKRLVGVAPRRYRASAQLTAGNPGERREFDEAA